MAYDETLSQRMRDALAGMQGVSEKKMMGGLCFMLNGNMIGGADRTKDGVGRFMFRVGKDNAAAADALPKGEVMEMGGRTMSGLYFVDADDCDDALMQSWLSLALSFVTTLPPK